MAKEKVTTSAPKTEYEQMLAITEAKNKTKQSVVKLHIKASTSYQKYIDYKEKGKFKEAAQELKWCSFNQKLKDFTEKMLEFLDRVEDMGELFAILGEVNEGLAAITGFQQGSDIKSLKKNLKGMTKCIRKFEKIADELMATMDNVFGDKPNIFVRFIRFITGKQKSDEDVLKELEAKVNITGQEQPKEETEKKSGGTDNGKGGINGGTDDPEGWT